VADATALERNLNLVLQVLEITDKVVVCVNLMDEAKRKGIEIDHRSLSRDLGVPAVPTTARTGAGLPDLLQAVAGVIEGEISTKPFRSVPPPGLAEAVDELVPMIESLAPGLPNARWVAYRLLEGDLTVRQALEAGELNELVQRQAGPVEAHSPLVALEGRQ
jgi:ferrous iron transport protein B